jgi:hypothetical protein
MKARWNVKGLDEYLEQLVAAEKDVDKVVSDVLNETSQYALGTLLHFLYASSETWTGSTAKTLFATPVQIDGNYIYIEIGADVKQDPAGWYKEFGRPSQAAEPFLRPTLQLYRNKELKRLMGKVLEQMGLPTS